MIAAVHVEAAVARSPDEAFARFTDGLGEWWPPEYTWSGSSLVTIEMAPGEGGLCTERGPHGFRCDWGRVVAWEPPARVAFTWQISPSRVPQPDPRLASTVDVRFTAEGDRTRVDLTHTGFEWHGDGAEHYRDAMASSQGWAAILARFATPPSPVNVRHAGP